MTIITLTTENFDEVVAENDIVIIDFWAEWCKPCAHFAPTFAEVAAHPQHSDLTFAKVDVETHPQLAEDFNIRSLPTVMVIRSRVAVYAEPGTMSGATLDDLIAQTRMLDMEKVKNHINATEGKE